MADLPETTSPEKPAPNWRRRGLIAAAVAAVLGMAVSVVILNRAPLAERLVRDRLTEMGLGGSNLDIMRLTLWRVEVRNLTTGPAGTAHIARLGMDLSWPSWTQPRVSGLSLDGVRLSLSVKDGALGWGDLGPLLAGGSGGGAPVLPVVTVNDAIIDIDAPGGRLALSLADVETAPVADGGITLKSALVDVVHPLGQASLRASGQRGADGKLSLDLAVEDAVGTAGPVSLAAAVGSLRLSGDPARPAEMSAEGTFTVSGLGLPGGFLAGGTLNARIDAGRAVLSADLKDEGMDLTLEAKAEGAPFDPAAPALVTVRATAANLAHLPAGAGLNGSGVLELKTEGALADLMSGALGRLPPVNTGVSLTGVELPGLPGAWAIRGRTGVAMTDETVTLTFAEPVSVSGHAWGGDVTASVLGTLRLGVSPFRVAGFEMKPSRLTLARLALGQATVTGPLALTITPRKDGMTFAPDGGPFVLTKADLALAAESPSLGLRAGGHSAILRTAGVTGGLTVTLPDHGAPNLRLDLAGLNAHVPDLDVEAEGLSLTANSRGGPDASWNFQAKAKALRHTAAAPIAVTAKGHWNPRRWSAEGTLRQERTDLIASFAANADARSGAGRARVDTVPLNLAGIPGGVHAATPLLAPFVRDVTGTVQVSAVAAWDKAGPQPVQVTASLRGAGITPAAALLPPALKGAVAGIGSLSAEFTVPPDDPAAGRGVVAVAGGNLRLGPTQATGISGRIEFDRLWPVHSPPGQEVSIERVVAALPGADGRLRFQIHGPASVTVEQAEVTGIGGRLWVRDISVTDGVPPKILTLNVDNLGLADLAAQVNILGLRADGRLSGRIPLELGAGSGMTIRDGLLSAQGQGQLAFVPPTRAPAAQPGDAGRMDLVLDILQDLRFDTLTLTLDGDARKDVRIQVRVQGRNPKIQQGRPVDLTVNLAGNIGEAIQAELQNFDIKGLSAAGAGGK